MKKFVIALSLATIPFASTPSHAVVALSGPAAHITGFATPVVVVPSGGPLTEVNLDPIFPHDFVASDATRPNITGSWCVGYPEGTCPLFWSPLIGVGESAPVQGLEGLPIGKRYNFTCTLHTGMRGILVIA